MTFITHECCDICGKHVTRVDQDGDLVWEGVRLFMDGMSKDLKSVPYGHGSQRVPDSPAHSFQCRENRLRSTGSSSTPMPTLYVPGTACSVACVEKSLLEWIEAAKKQRPEQTGRNVEL